MRLFTVAAAGLCLVLPACKPVAGADTTVEAPQSTPASTPAGAIAPAAYDWFFVAHGGSGDLTFGDGDWAEGQSLLSMSCLPGSRRATLSDGAATQVTLAAGDQTATVTDSEGEPGIETSTTAPVMAAFRATRSLTLTTPAGPQVLAAKAEGATAVEEFFTYCGG